MLQLFLDTATDKGILGLADHHTLIEEVHLPTGLGNSKWLFLELEKLFKKRELAPSELKLITCGVGPGSYTGMRVAAACAQGLAYALKIPLVGFCSLEGFCLKESGDFLVLVDAKISGVYLQKGHFDGKQRQILSNPQVIALDQLKPFLLAAPSIITPLLFPLKKKIETLYPELDLKWEEVSPQGKLITERGLEIFYAGKICKEKGLELLYLRATQAEIERQSKTLS